MFQDYALFPHMTVRENVEYGLRAKRVAKDERRERAVEALALVPLDAVAERVPVYFAQRLTSGADTRAAGSQSS